MAEDAETRGLVARASGGDAHAVEELLARYLPDLRGYVHNQAGGLVRGREETVDLVQSVCREVLEHLADERLEYRGEAEFRQWLYRAAQLKLMNRHRYWRAERRDPEQETSSDAEAVLQSLLTPSRAAIAREDFERFERGFALLPEREREVVRLAHVEGRSHQEIGEELGIEPNHSRQILHRALVKLSKLLVEAK